MKKIILMKGYKVNIFNIDDSFKELYDFAREKLHNYEAKRFVSLLYESKITLCASRDMAEDGNTNDNPTSVDLGIKDFPSQKLALSIVDGIIMQNIKDKKTLRGHEIRFDYRADNDENQIILWFPYWDEINEIDNLHHIGIVKIQSRVVNDKYVFFAYWFTENENSPWYKNYTEESDTTSEEFLSLDSIFAAVDRHLEKY